MRINDKQLGKPEILYTDLKSNIEALTGLEKGSVAFASDTNEIGKYDGVSWFWFTKLTVSASTPGSPSVNDLWVDIS